MTAFMAFLAETGIDATTTTTYELHADIKPIKRGAELLAPRDSGNLKGGSHFAVAAPNDIEPYPRWLPVDSYGFDVRHSAVAGSAAFTAFLQPSSVSPQLIEACAKNFSFDFVRFEIHLGTTASFKRLAVTMKTATIISFRNYSGNISGQGTVASGHVECYTIQFEECEWGHVEDDGTSQESRRWSIG